MAYAVMPEAQEPYVCEEDCDHRDCAQLRELIGSPCALCAEPIEGGQRYISREGGEAHWICHREEEGE